MEKKRTRKKTNSKRSVTRKIPAPAVGLGDSIELLERKLHAVREIGAALASHMGLDALFQTVVPNVTKLMNAKRSTLFLYDDDSEQIWSKVAQGEAQHEIRLELGAGIAGWVAKHGKSLCIADAYEDKRFNRDVDARTGFRTRSIVAVPLLDSQKNLIGVLQALNRKHGIFSEDDVGLLEAIAAEVAYAVENAQQAQTLIDQNKELYAARARADRRREELDLLYQLERETSASADLDALLDSVIVRACNRLRSQAGSVLLLEKQKSELYFRGVSGVTPTTYPRPNKAF
ncbi:MAG: GAF domain-containing protein [Myxococcota bacterium]